MDNLWAKPGVLCEVRAGTIFCESCDPNDPGKPGPDWKGPYKVTYVKTFGDSVAIALYGDVLDNYWMASGFKPITTVKSDAAKFNHLKSPIEQPSIEDLTKALAHDAVYGSAGI